MISHKWLYLADIFEHQIMLMNNLRNFPPVTLGIFKSTLLQEERRSIFQGLCNYIFYFNPRSYKRSDLQLIFRELPLHTISIHAPTRGATKERTYQIAFPEISIHAPTRGATAWASMHSDIKLFQSTLLQEERLCPRFVCISLMIFQSTLLQEERHVFVKLVLLCFAFQSTLLQEERLSGNYPCITVSKISIHAPTRGATINQVL